MIALDTSALLRYLTNDDPPLARQVADLLEGEHPVAISSLVLLEAAHALRGAHYGRDNPAVADAFIELLGHENVVLTDLPSDLASAAIAAVRHLSARHLSDALVAAAARHAGVSELVTNDRKFASQLVPIRQLG